uniref:Glutathione S-transferase 1 n=1 Tax=Apopellia endiviifolia (species B) TaxID=119729 RepID=A0A6B7NW01_9MARC|nr:glutathione S-transferase 1 [Apopellia endiviifolia (species B)]
MQFAYVFTCGTGPPGIQLLQPLRSMTHDRIISRRGWQHHNVMIQGVKGRSLPGFGLRRVGIPGWGLDLLSYATRRIRIEVGRGEIALTVQHRVASWEILSDKLQGVELEPSERIADAKERVFGLEQESEIVFYRDNSSWCPYCERVWLLLEEKKISYSIKKINMRCYGGKPAWYTSMVPSGLLPAVTLDGQLVTESLDIMFILEERFPNNYPLLPERGTPEFAAVDALLKLERKLFGAWLSRLTQSRGDNGAFEATMDRVNCALQRFKGPYFLGIQFSLVDAVFAPFLERIAASMPYWPGIQIRGADRWSAINEWFDAMDSRPSYQAMKSDDFGITHNLEPQIGSCFSAEAGAAYRALIDGTNGAWDLPLKSEVTAWGTDDGSGKDGAKEEAAQSLIENHEQIVKFALRGVEDGEKYRDAVDLAFRYLALSLLDGVQNVNVPKDQPKEVAIAASYLRERVGVPRDLTYPAARQLRAHLNWLVKQSGSRSKLDEVKTDDQKSWLEPAEISNSGGVLQESKKALSARVKLMALS